MNEITTLFTAIGDFFTNANWFQMVKWPFWILLTTVAAGGVYCARFSKKTLVNQGICSTLTLISIYLGAVLFYLYFPTLRTTFSELPFLSVSDQGVALVDPFAMDLATLAPLLLRLMILVFLVTAVDSYRAGGKTVFTWFFSQIATAVLALLAYAIVTAGITIILPAVLTRYAIIPVVVIAIVGVLMLCAKFIFTTVISEGNPYFSAVYKFFTINKGGSLFTISALSFLIVLAVLCTLHATGKTLLTYASVNATGLWIILLLIHVALYIFCMFYCDRKKG